MDNSASEFRVEGVSCAYPDLKLGFSRQVACSAKLGDECGENETADAQEA